MKQLKNEKMWLVGLVASALFLTACGGGGLQPSSFAGSSAVRGDSASELPAPQIDLQKIEQDAAAAESALIEAEAAIAEILDENGEVRLNFFSGNQSSSQFDFGAAGIFSKALEPLLNKIAEAVEKGLGGYKEGRLKLIEAIAKLDSSNPAHALLLQQLMEQMEKFDVIESSLQTVLRGVSSKINLVVDRLDLLISGWNPIVGLLLAGEIRDVKEVIRKFSERIGTL